MINDQVRQLSHQLRVFGVHAHFEARANEAQGKGLSHLEFLKLVLEDEAMQRRERVAKALTTRAKFRSSSDLEDWDQTFDRGLTKAKLREFSTHSFVEKKKCSTKHHVADAPIGEITRLRKMKSAMVDAGAGTAESSFNLRLLPMVCGECNSAEHLYPL